MMNLMRGHAIYEDKRLLDKATEMGHRAIDVLWTDASPLPRINAEQTLFSGDGTPMDNYYFATRGGAMLVAAMVRIELALLSN